LIKRCECQKPDPKPIEPGSRSTACAICHGWLTMSIYSLDELETFRDAFKRSQRQDDDGF
jgi:hypothetical protein